MVKKIYMEGGGNSRSFSDIRKHISNFIAKAGVPENTFRVVPCGSRSTTYKLFVNQIKKEQEENTVLLLVDAEGPVPAQTQSPWQHLKNRDGWDKPADATDEQCHLMVQFMESWFMADREALQAYYGQHFQAQSLPPNPAIEEIPKRDIEQKLKHATRHTSKGAYNKGTHSFEILSRLDSEKVRQASPYADRFFRTLLDPS